MEAMKPKILWQLPMKRVLYALLPLAAASVYFFGWRALLVLAVTVLAAFLTEYAFTRFTGEQVTSAVFVTGSLLALTLPPTIPLWIAAAAAVIGVFFGKMVFGGFGKNVYNPALVGRVFVYVSFAAPMSSRWVEPVASSPWAGFALFASDAVSGATPLAALRAGRPVELARLLLGNTAGSLGETSALLIALGGAYLIWRKAANWRIVLSSIAGFVSLQGVFWLTGVRGAADPLTALAAGGVLFGIVFMATDPISASQTQGGRWFYGGLIGVVTVLIRAFAVWPEGTMFAILLGNTFAPIIDYAVRERQRARKAASSQRAAIGAGAR
jgi:Na+-transporting NADH:ubiquinone oxidoreductase subunit B